MIKQPSPAHTAYMEALKAALHTVRDTPSQEILAVASQYIGMLLALQDRTKMTTDMGIELILRNIQIGNQMAVMNVPVAGHA